MKYFFLGIPTKGLSFGSAIRYYSKGTDIAKCFFVLGVPDNSDQETVRQAFLALVKRYHPDSGCPEADSVKFQEIESAYRELQQKFAKDRSNVNDGIGEYGLYYEEKQNEEVEEFDIEHTAPQHRQYLNYEGFGMGTPSQRERQFASYRAANAINNVNMYRINKMQDNSGEGLMKKDTKRRVKDIKTGFGMDRLVEDLIQESMARGDFDNLTGSGKPLKMGNSHENPYVDFVTHKMNQVLIDNGFTPTWILYQKEIRHRNEKLIEDLIKHRAKLGPCPLSEEESIVWKRFKSLLADEVAYINQKINNYNLMVPILQKQMLQINLEKEADKILSEGAYLKPEERNEIEKKQKENLTFFDLVHSIFR